MIEAITDINFTEKTDTGLVITDFWATWCGPCRMLSPILEEIAEEEGDRVKIVKMDVDANPKTPAEFGVMGIPTLLIKKDGKVVETLVGLQEKEHLEALIAKHA